jgi:transposase, IS5 family
MIKRENSKDQDRLFYQRLSEMIDLKDELCQLSEIIPWHKFDEEFTKYYRPDFGRPAKRIRLMVSLLLLRQLQNVSDERVVKMWKQNPYWQYFSGEEYFQITEPCEASELVKFRNRIGIDGVERILSASIQIHGKDAEEQEVIPDTTVQEKNVTFPTDTKLHMKIIGKCLKWSKSEHIQLRQSYTRTIKKLRWSTRYLRNPRRVNEGRKAISKIRTIAGRLVRELERKLSPAQIALKQQELEIMKRILKQRRDDKNKIYSLHEPEVSCIAKGKEHKKYEFGSKVSLLVTKSKGIIVGALSFRGNPYDGNTLEAALEQSKRIRKSQASKALVDEGYRGRSKIGETEIIRVHQPKLIKESKRKWRKWFKRRASVEARIGHLKRNHGLGRNYLKGIKGDNINAMLAAAAYNLRLKLIDLVFICRFLKLTFLKNIFNYFLFST